MLLNSVALKNLNYKIPRTDCDILPYEFLVREFVEALKTIQTLVIPLGYSV